MIILTEVAEGSEIKRLVSHSGNYHEVAEGLEIKGISAILTRLDDVAEGLEIKGITGSAILTGPMMSPKAWILTNSSPDCVNEGHFLEILCLV